MTQEERYDIVDEALQQWGAQEQWMMAAGEIGELLALFGRRVQGRAATKDFISEIADVKIMLMQIENMLLIAPDDVERVIDEKLERLASRIEAARAS